MRGAAIITLRRQRQRLSDMLSQWVARAGYRSVLVTWARRLFVWSMLVFCAAFWIGVFSLIAAFRF